MAKEILTEELGAVMEPLLPPPLARPKGGRPRIGIPLTIRLTQHTSSRSK